MLLRNNNISLYNTWSWPSAFIAPKSPWNHTMPVVHTVPAAVDSANISLSFNWGKKGYCLCSQICLSTSSPVFREEHFTAGLVLGSALQEPCTLSVFILLALWEFMMFKGVLVLLLPHAFKQRGAISPPPLIFSSPCLILCEMPPFYCERGEQVFFLFFSFLHFLFWLAVPAWNMEPQLLRNKPVYSAVAAMCIYPWTSVIRLKGHPHQNDNHNENCNKDGRIHTRERQHSVNNGTKHYPVVIWRGHQ